MSENVIFCFSGSGNCLDIAKNIAAGLGDTDIVSLRRAPRVTDVRFCRRVGIVVPCHAGGLPLGVADFIRTLSVKPNPYTFGVVSCAAYPGTALADINEIVALDYGAVISHQSSCIWLMPHTLMLPIKTPEKAQKRSEELAAAVAADVKVYKHAPLPPARALNRIEQSAWPTLARSKAELLSISGKCVGCGQCARLCPKGNIKLIGGRPDFGTDCIGCLSCLQFCPQGAIHMGGATLTRERWHNPNVSAEELNEAVIHID